MLTSMQTPSMQSIDTYVSGLDIASLTTALRNFHESTDSLLFKYPRSHFLCLYIFWIPT